MDYEIIVLAEALKVPVSALLGVRSENTLSSK